MAPLSKLMEVLDGCSVGWFGRTAQRCSRSTAFRRNWLGWFG